MTFEETKRKASNMIKNAAEKTKSTVRSACLSVEAFAVNHPREFTAIMIIGVPAVAKAASGAYKAAVKSSELKAKDLRMYDPSLRLHLHLRRPIRTNEAILINERRAAGEKLIDILRDMKLLDL